MAVSKEFALSIINFTLITFDGDICVVTDNRPLIPWVAADGHFHVEKETPNERAVKANSKHKERTNKRMPLDENQR